MCAFQEDASNNSRLEEGLQLSLQRYKAGDVTACIAAVEEALRLRPEYAPAYKNICGLCPNRSAECIVHGLPGLN